MILRHNKRIIIIRVNINVLAFIVVEITADDRTDMSESTRQVILIKIVYTYFVGTARYF